VPEGIDDLKVGKRLLASTDIEILGGFGPLAGKAFRVGIMGPLATEDNVLLLLGELQKALTAEGFATQGNAVAAAENYYTVQAVPA
jgi:alanine-glyoxylate transaminase/serine-glyoxylate transaminase/serine-pyruvate transaminase